MTQSLYIKGSDGATLWLPRGNDKFRQECEERRKLLLKEIKDEDLKDEDEN